jgi:hypothetical protein
VIRDIALSVIKAAGTAVKESEEDFLKSIRQTTTENHKEIAKDYQKQIKQSEKRIAELDNLIRRIYEDNVSGKLSDKRFKTLSAEYENEQSDLEKTVKRLSDEIAALNTDIGNSEKFVEIVRKYTDFSELTPKMIAEFIDKIEVHAADKSSGEREQKVDVYLNFIGKFELPIPQLSAEEAEAEEWKRRKRERCREAQRRYAAKKRAELENQNLILTEV